MNSNRSYSPETVKLGCDLCDLDLWPWPFAWTLLLSLVITPENFIMIRWWEHSQKGVTDGRTDWTIHRSAWSQLKTGVNVVMLEGKDVICTYCNTETLPLNLPDPPPPQPHPHPHPPTHPSTPPPTPHPPTPDIGIELYMAKYYTSRPPEMVPIVWSVSRTP